MKRARAKLSTLLRTTLVAAERTVYADRAGLYVVDLFDDHAFTFATAMHDRVRCGPSPTELRSRAVARGDKAPQQLAHAPVETLGRIAEYLAGEGPDECKALAADIRAHYRTGGVPVLMLTEGVRIVRRLDELLEELEGTRAVPAMTSWGPPVVGLA